MKTKLTIKIFFLGSIIFLTLFVPTTHAASGINKQINFQGKLVDSNGLNVSDSTYSVVFTLYDAASGGNTLWTETQNVTTSGGIFQVALGSTTTLGLSAVNFNSNTIYLGIKVGSDAEMTPRIQFAAVPYAFNADKLDGVVATQSATGFNLAGGTSSVSTVAFTTTGGTLTLQPGVAGGLTFDTNGANTLGLVTSANAITFGGVTNNPSYAFNGTGGLTVNGGGVNNITFGSNAGNGTVVVQPNAGGQAGLIINKQGFNDIFTASAAGITRFTLSNNGSIGLNTPLPLATLDVRANPINGGTIPVASFSGKTSFAALVVNNSGVGDILAASSGGQSRFRVTNNGSVLFQGDTISSSTSASLSNNGSGAVINALGDQGSMVPNAGFEANTTNSPFADGWVVSATNSAAVTRDTAVSAKGASSAKVTLTNGATAFYSACIPLAGTGGNYTLNWYAKATAPIPTVRAYIDGYTTKANCQSNTTPTISPAQGATITAAWVKYGSNTVAVTGWGASSTWGRVHFFIACTVNCTNAVVNIDGVRVIESTTGDGLDYAENYPADPTNIPEAGDVVALIASGSAGQVEPAHRYMDQTTLGVVSTNPGQVLDDGSISDPKVAVALSGRVPVKVSTQNGAIHLGDNLTSSAIPGVAVKAISTGPVIGVALEDFSCDSTSVCEGKVIMFIKNTYYAFAPVNTGLMLSSGGQDASVLMSLFQQPNFSIATSAAALQNTRNGLTVSGQATVSADLRVKGNGLFEGIVTIVDTLTTNNFIVNHVADFFGNVVFHGDVSIQGRPTFTRDTGGFAVIKKGSDRVQVTFSKEYEQIPVVNASISFEARDEDAKKQEEIEKSILSSNTNFIITDRSTKGFAILLAKPSEQDMTFSWVAIAVDKPIVFQSSLPLPTPTISPTPSPE